MKDCDIMIFGISHCGKTTLSRMLAERFHYPVIHRDALAAALQAVYGIPEAIIPVGTSVGLEGFSLFLHRFLRQSRYEDAGTTRYILDGTMSVKNCRRYFHPEKNIVYFLGMAEITSEELFNQIRGAAYQRSWTARLTDEELLNVSSGIIAQSVSQKRACAKYGLPYVETSGDREAVLSALADEIAARIEQLDREDEVKK